MLKKTLNFNDGVVKIYDIENVSQPGKMPTEKLVLKETLRYYERTVGLARKDYGKQDGADIKYVLRCPLRRNVSSLNVAIPNDGKQYRVWNVQYPEDIDPPVMDVTLQELTAKYDIWEG